MPVLNGTIQQAGALVDIRLAWSSTAIHSRRQTLQPIPPPLDTRGVLDTGAEVTCIDPALIRALGVPFHNVTVANVPAGGGLLFGSQYEVNLTILHPSGQALDNLVISDLLIVELPLRSLGYDVLVGRDILNQLRMVWDGPRRWFELEY